jgi:hypothetical protein
MGSLNKSQLRRQTSGFATCHYSFVIGGVAPLAQWKLKAARPLQFIKGKARAKRAAPFHARLIKPGGGNNGK